MRLLDDLPALARIDRSGMLRRAASLPGQCREAWGQGLEWKVPASVRSARQIVMLGVGGSAIGADLVQGILADNAPRPILVNRTYTLPRWVGRETLALVFSYSGNTEETLSAAEQARTQGAKLLAITSGGMLAPWADCHGVPQLRIPSGLPPRSAVGYMVFAPLGLFVRLGWVSRTGLGVEAALSVMERWVDSALEPDVSTGRNPAKKLAASLVGRLPVLYGAAGGWEGVTYRWRTQVEENAKSLAFHHIFPEATHNEISAWLQPRSLMRQLTALFLTDPAIHPRILRRMEFMRRIVRSQGARALIVSVPGRRRVERLLKLVALGDFVSVYLGILYRMDPTPVERVEALKQYLKRPVPFQGQRGQTPLSRLGV